MILMLSLDPGESTGWGVWRYNGTTRLTHIRHGIQKDGLEGAIELLKEYLPYVDEVVSESFILDGRTALPVVTPLRIEGAIAALWRGPTFFQRNTYKHLVPDETLKRLGLWWPGPGHDRDAARHAIARLLSIEHMPTMQWVHPIPAE